MASNDLAHWQNVGRQKGRLRHRVFRAIGVMVLLIGIHSCTTANYGSPGISGPGMYNPITGKYTQEFSVPLDRTWALALDALQALEITPVKQVKDQLGGALLAMRADGTGVELTLRADGLAWTKVTIAVGRGEEAAAVRIGQEMERRLQR